jgi:hypothetical protein
MSLAAQLWGSTNERIHTIGTLSLGLSAIFFLSLEPAIKQEGLLIFTTFGLGAALIGVATLRNSWGRWRYDSDTLILLRKTGHWEFVHHSAVMVLGWYISWRGRVAHVDCGRFTVRRARPDDRPSGGSTVARCYGLFRAAYWMACSSITFQTIFGMCALAYSLWLLNILYFYQQSTI